MRVLHVFGDDNGWGIANRARYLAAALAARGDYRCQAAGAAKLPPAEDFDVVHLHSAVLIRRVPADYLRRAAVWGFEVVSERSLAYLQAATAQARTADFVIAKNPRLVALARGHVRVEPQYIPNGVAPEVFSPRPFRLGWAGRKDGEARKKYKGLDLIVAAWAEANKRLAGQLKIELVFDPGDWPRVVSHAEMARWYRTLDALAVASAAEGCSNVTLEALACGVPVISTDCGIAPELAGQGLLRLHERSVEGLAAAMVELARPMARRAGFAAEFYGWTEIAELCDRVYRAALAGKAGRKEATCAS